jgi:anti-sigma B factor antagonist
MALTVTVAERSQGSYLVSLEGDLDCDTFTECAERISPFLSESAKVLMFDMAKLDYISSLGLQVINNTRRIIESCNGHMVFINVQPLVREIFEIVCPKALDFTFRSLEEADRYLDSVAGNQKA